MGNEKNLSIIFVLDERVSHERIAVLSRSIQGLMQNFTVEIIKGNEISEAQILEKMQTSAPHLILLPLHRYQSWNRIEGALGLNRTQGAAYAGYFCEPLPLYQLPDPNGQNRRIILDFVHLSALEIATLVRSLILDTRRTGLRPLLDANSLIYCESWYSNQGQGNRIDHVLGLPEISNTPWAKRSSSIRIILMALWTLVYEEGPGKTETVQAGGARPPKAYFQLGADNQSLVFRLYYYTVPHALPKDVVQQFWPDQTVSTKAAQLLLKYSDFVRVHSIQETSDIEVVIGLFHSAPSEKNHAQARTLWIEPLSARLISEPPFEAPGPQSPLLRALPTVSFSDAKLRVVDPNAGAKDASRNRVILDATAKIKELKERVNEKEATIRELRSGGIGTAQPLPPPDPESLLEAFQERYMDARFQIRQFEVQIAELEKRKATPQEIETLKQKMDALMNREKAWIKKLMTTLEVFKDSQKKNKGKS